MIDLPCPQADPAPVESLPPVGIPSDPSAARSLPTSAPHPPEAAFFPKEPQSLEEMGIRRETLDSLVLKYLLHMGSTTGRDIAEQLHLPFRLTKEILAELKAQRLVTHRTVTAMSDYEYELTEEGRSRARRYTEQCTYFGAAPVDFDDYVKSVERQSVRNVRLQITDLCRAFSDLLLSPAMISQIGQAANAGKALFLYGPPGNGKTSISERIIRAVTQHIWIPRTIVVNGDIVRLFDPSCHEQVDDASNSPHHSLVRESVESSHDKRWVRVRRPSLMVGGELTLEQLEFKFNPATGINEAPVQLKSNGGALVIDDFGRQRITTSELLNRWIVPLEKGYDFLSLQSGRQIQVPFAQLLVFATNLEPRMIVDEAFLRRIPYKIEIGNPTEAEFRELLQKLAVAEGFQFESDVFDYLVNTHYATPGRQFRFCHARDLLLQVRNLCEFQDRPLELSPRAFDVAVRNYFAGLE